MPGKGFGREVGMCGRGRRAEAVATKLRGVGEESVQQLRRYHDSEVIVIAGMIVRVGPEAGTGRQPAREVVFEERPCFRSFAGTVARRPGTGRKAHSRRAAKS